MVRAAIVSENAVTVQMVWSGAALLCFDSVRVPAIDVAHFDPSHWAAASAYERGRGNAYAVDTPFGAAVLRHYHRGGLLASWLGDRFLWGGVERARPIREFRLLARLTAQGLPVPRPLAALVQRRGRFYTGDLLMQRIERSRPLSSLLPDGRAWTQTDWCRIGMAIGRLHAAGVDHVDLNAHNLLLGEDGAVHVIDFDRARVRTSGRDWQQSNLQRLARSLRKLDAQGFAQGRGQQCWRELLQGHRSLCPGGAS